MNLYYITGMSYFYYLTKKAFYRRSYDKELDWPYAHLGININL